MPKPQFLIFSLCLSIFLFVPIGTAQTFEPMVYTQTHVSGIWQRGYLNGPASGAMLGYIGAMVMDASGNIYTASSQNGNIRVLDAATQRVWNLAGIGSRGYKDGPAQSAMFDMGGQGYAYASIAIHSSGALYLADGHNKAIRKIWKDPAHGGQWWVSTFWSTTAILMAVTVDSFGNVWTQSSSAPYLIYKITQGGAVTTYSALDQNNETVGPAMAMAADGLGNIYTLTRTPYYRVYKVTSSGVVTKTAGSDWVPHQSGLCLYSGASIYPVDGPAANAVVYQATTIAVTSDGTTVYWGNGDESNIRRLKDGNVMTLFRDGWHTNTCMFEGRSSSSDWILGGPMWATASGVIYLFGNNPPDQLQLRKITP